MMRLLILGAWGYPFIANTPNSTFTQSGSARLGEIDLFENC